MLEWTGWTGTEELSRQFVNQEQIVKDVGAHELAR